MTEADDTALSWPTSGSLVTITSYAVIKPNVAFGCNQLIVKLMFVVSEISNAEMFTVFFSTGSGDKGRVSTTQ